ncbi:hypothetical protein D3C85_1676850 [compost metagenome]
MTFPVLWFLSDVSPWQVVTSLSAEAYYSDTSNFHRNTRMIIDIIMATCIIQVYSFIIQVILIKASELLLGELYESS